MTGPTQQGKHRAVNRSPASLLCVSHILLHLSLSRASSLSHQAFHSLTRLFILSPDSSLSHQSLHSLPRLFTLTFTDRWRRSPTLAHATAGTHGSSAAREPRAQTRSSRR